MSPFELDVIIPVLAKLNRQFGAIHALLLSHHISKSERTARHYLRRMELAGAVERPHGLRKGWVVSEAFQLRNVPAAV